jgi:hypothetical protein
LDGASSRGGGAKNTPQPIVDKLAAALDKTLRGQGEGHRAGRINPAEERAHASEIQSLRESGNRTLVADSQGRIGRNRNCGSIRGCGSTSASATRATRASGTTVSEDYECAVQCHELRGAMQS